MLLVVILGFLINVSFFQQAQAQPATCVTCMNCQDTYDGTDYNATCSSTTTNADSCQKLRIQIPGTTFVAKACAKNCKEQTIIAGPFRVDIACCTSSNCNGATTIFLQPILFLITILFS